MDTTDLDAVDPDAVDPDAESDADVEPQESAGWWTRRRFVLLGRLISFVAVLLLLRWVVLRLGADGAALLAYRPTPSFLVAIALGIPVIVASELVPAYAWHRLLAVLGDSGRGERRRNLLIHAKLQVMRYLPGHAFVLARHAVTRGASREERVPHSALAAAATCEAVGMIAGAGALACLGFAVAFGDGAIHFGDAVPESVLHWAPWLTLALVISTPPLVARLAGSRLLPGVESHRAWDSYRAFCLYALYFAAQGLVFGVLLVQARGADATSSWTGPFLAGSAALPLAWGIGYLTPATPAGAGALEAVLVAILGSRYGAVEVLAAALGFRIASVAAHVLLAFLATFLDPRRSPRTRKAPAEGAEGHGLDTSRVTT